jgi:hypothetical protein
MGDPADGDALADRDPIADAYADPAADSDGDGDAAPNGCIAGRTHPSSIATCSLACRCARPDGRAHIIFIYFTQISWLFVRKITFDSRLNHERVQ